MNRYTANENSWITLPQIFFEIDLSPSLCILSQHLPITNWLQEIAMGKADALSHIYDNYAPALLGVIMKNVPDQATAEDLLQEVFVKIWQNAASYQADKASAYTWMLNIARNHSIDYLRSKRFTQSSKTKGVDDYVHLEGSVGSNQTLVDAIGIEKPLQKLPEEQRKIVMMTYYGGYTQEEISEALSVPLGTVKSRLRLALKKLRELMIWIC